ncbi:MAG: Hsp33 family molecular chaperone HslO [Myxococcota bacterium]
MDAAPTGTLLRGLTADRAVRVIAVEASAPAEHTRTLHGLGPDAARIGTEALVAAALSSAHIKGDEQLTLQIQGERPRFSVYVDATAEGALRARVSPPDLQLPGGTFHGILMVTKHAPGGEVYRGATAIEGTTLEQALGSHFRTSQQVDAVVRIGFRANDSGTVRIAQGVLLERLPDEPDVPSVTPAAFTQRFGPLADPGRHPLDALMTSVALGRVLGDPIEVLARHEVSWRCRCSRARIEETLRSLGGATLQELIDEDHGATVSCHFCTTDYVLSEDDLRRLQGSLPA